MPGTAGWAPCSLRACSARPHPARRAPGRGVRVRADRRQHRRHAHARDAVPAPQRLHRRRGPHPTLPAHASRPAHRSRSCETTSRRCSSPCASRCASRPGAGFALERKVVHACPTSRRRSGSRERVRTFLETHGLAEEIVEFEQSTKTAAAGRRRDGLRARADREVARRRRRRRRPRSSRSSPGTAKATCTRSRLRSAARRRRWPTPTRFEPRPATRSAASRRSRFPTDFRCSSTTRSMRFEIVFPAAGTPVIDGAHEPRRPAGMSRRSRGTHIALARELVRTDLGVSDSAVAENDIPPTLHQSLVAAAARRSGDRCAVGRRRRQRASARSP